LADQISAVELDSANELLDKTQRIQYVEGAKKIAEVCKGISPFLDDLFLKTYSKSVQILNS
jgi:hypothetical protein